MSTWPGQRLETDLGFPGYGPFPYTLLGDPKVLATELFRAANATSDVMPLSGARVDSVTFQPCLMEEEASQDRRFCLETERGVLVGVLDGHGGHETVDHVLKHLPDLIESSISSSTFEPSQLPTFLSSAIQSIDNRITQDILGLVPNAIEEGSDDQGTVDLKRAEEALAKLSDEEVDAIVEKNHEVLLRGMTGTTALVAFVDKEKENLWIAHVGDCQAVLGTKSDDGSWRAELININHNGAVKSEADRIRAEHPGEEEEVVAKDRVLAAIAVTRAIGDQTFKLPASYISRLFLSPRAPAYRTQTNIERVVLPRIKTPPYLNAKADIHHLALSKDKKEKQFLILCSDGLSTLAIESSPTDYRSLGKEAGRMLRENIEREAVDMWVHVAGASIDSSESESGGALQNQGERKTEDESGEDNVALAILRAAMGNGDPKDVERVSRLITVETMGRWMDDTTISVVSL